MDALQWVGDAASGYPGLFLLCTVAGFLAPVPEDAALVYAGLAVANGRMSMAPAVAASAAGLFVRDVMVFGLGKFFGEALLAKPWMSRFLGPARVERARQLVASRGAHSVLIGRLLVGFRTPVFFVAGGMGLGTTTFAVWDAVGLLAVVPLEVSLGRWFGAPVLAWLLRAPWVVVVVAVVALVVVAMRRRRAA